MMLFNFMEEIGIMMDNERLRFSIFVRWVRSGNGYLYLYCLFHCTCAPASLSAKYRSFTDPDLYLYQQLHFPCSMGMVAYLNA
jgi:hypothetical protein